MPAKPKYTREEVIDAAFEIARRNGIESITAREVGKRLNTSPSPIFTAFECMEQLKAEVWKRAGAEYDKRINAIFAQKTEKPYKQIGIETVRFAIDEPNLFRILFVRRRPNPRHGNIEMQDIQATDKAVKAIAENYLLSLEAARALHYQVWFYTFGLVVMCMNGVADLTDDQIEELLTRQFEAALLWIKSQKSKQDNI